MFYAIAAMGLGVAVFILIVAPFSLSLLPVVGGLLAIAAFQLRGPRLGAHVSDESVVLVRNFKTIKVPINDVARVVVRPHPPALRAGHLEREGRFADLDTGAGAEPGVPARLVSLRCLDR
jgi:hypothetical protein